MIPTIPTRRAALILSSLAPLALSGGPAAAQSGTAPPVFCGKTYVFAPAGLFTVVADEPSTLVVDTLHYVGLTQPLGQCFFPPYEVSMTATLQCTPGPSGEPIELGPFEVGIGYSQIQIEIPVVAGPPRDCLLEIESRLSLSDGSVTAQTATVPVAVRPGAAGVPDVQLIVEQTMAFAHPGDTAEQLLTVVNNSNQPMSLVLEVVSENVADVPEVLSGPTPDHSGVYSVSDPVGDAHGVALEMGGGAAGVTGCINLPMPAHERETTGVTFTIDLDPRESQDIQLTSRSDPLARDGATSSLAVRLGPAADPNELCAVAYASTGALFTEDAQLLCDPPTIGLPAMDASTSDVVIGLAGEVFFATAKGDLVMAWNGVDIQGTPDYSNGVVLDLQTHRAIMEESNARNMPPGDATIDVSFPVEFSSPSGAVTVDPGIITGAPSDTSHLSPLIEIDVDLVSPPTNLDRVESLHQVSAVGITESFQFVEMAVVDTRAVPVGPSTVSFEISVVATEPPAEPFIGLSVQHDVRSVATEAVDRPRCQGDPGGHGDVDLDDNGVIDACEAEVTIAQVRWTDPLGNVGPPTQLCEFTITTPQPADDDVAFLNVVMADDWTIQNAPVFRVEREAEEATYTYNCPFDVPQGTEVPSIDCFFTLTEEPLADSPCVDQVCTLESLDVNFHDVTPGCESDVDCTNFGLYVPEGVEGYFNPFASANLTIKQRLSVPGISEPQNFCAPGAVTRSLAWMNDEYALGLSLSDPQMLLGPVAEGLGTTSWGTPFGDGVQRLESTLDGLGLKDKLLISSMEPHDPNPPTPESIAKAICEGKDVLVSVLWLDEMGQATGGHQMTMVGVAIDEQTGAMDFAMKDDGTGAGDQQGDGLPDQGVTLLTMALEPGIPGSEPDVYRFNGLARNHYIRRVTTICPRTATHVKSIADRLADILLAVGGGAAGLAEPPEIAAAKVDESSSFLLARLENNYAEAPALVSAGVQLSASASELHALVLQYVATPTTELEEQITMLITGSMADAIAVLDQRFDCNGNDVDDGYEIESGLARDGDGDEIPDECGQCPGDSDGSGAVDVDDLVNVILDWGTAGHVHGGDVDGNGVVNVDDLVAVILAWGPCV